MVTAPEVVIHTYNTLRAKRRLPAKLAKDEDLSRATDTELI
jgi:hypothetical protein